MPGVNDTSTAVEEIVARALELRDEGRSDWLEAACDGDETRMDEVRQAVVDASALPQLLKSIAKRDGRMGQVLDGRFELRERLGAGAMGVVYAARDTTLDRQVAVKVLRHGLTERESTAQRFAREARAMASVEHEAVITIHDRGTTSEDEPFLVMELVDGVALSEIVQAAAERPTARDLERAAWIEALLGLDLRGEASYVRTVTRWIAELANGLERVHKAGVLHRDIKPSNIIVRRDGKPVLLDFGIALLDGDSSLTRGQTSVGTPAYMPPEALGRNQRTAASDVYSLAATLHHLLALAPPYEGDPSQVLAAIATREPVPARTHRPGIPRDLQAILDRGLARKPSARYASCADLEADLRAFLEFRPISVRPLTAPERWLRRAVRSRMVQGAAAVVAVLALVAGGLRWRDQVAEARAGRYLDVLRHLPPSLGVLDAPNRRYPVPAQRAQIAALLDEAVELGVQPTTSLLLRATFRYDHGDGVGAAEDARRLADAVGTPFARSLAERYASAANDGGEPQQLDLQDLPDLDGAEDAYVLAFHAVRWGQEGYALELLDDADVRAIDHAELLRLVCTDLEAEDTTEEYRRALALYDEVRELELRLGARTASTAHLAGWALGAASRYSEALAALDDGLALTPDEHTLHTNASLAALGAGLLDRAAFHAERAVELRPRHYHTWEKLVWAYVAGERFDELAQRLERAPLPDGRAYDAWRRAQFTILETRRALALRRGGDAERAAVAVEAALAHRAELLRIAPEYDLTEPTFVVLQGLESGDPGQLAAALVRGVTDDPLQWWKLRDVAGLLPEDLDADGTAAVGELLTAMIDQLRTIDSTE